MMKTTRVWPIPPQSPLYVIRDGIPFTISAYAPPTSMPDNFTLIRLLSVDLWLENSANFADLSIEVSVGIGNLSTITGASLVDSADVSPLDPFHPSLTPHRVHYNVTGIASEITEYQPRGGAVIPVWAAKAIIGSFNKRRPLRYRWRKAERPEMQLYSRSACPCLWGLPRFVESGGVGMKCAGQVTFECEQ